MHVNETAVKTALVKAGTLALDAVRGSVDEYARVECETVAEEVMAIGIENTVRALLLVGVSADKLVSVTHEVWDIPKDEAAHVAASLKRDMALDGLSEYLTVLGMDSHAVRAFRFEYAVRSRLRRDSELLGLWNEPEKLYRKLQRLGKALPESAE